MPRVVVVGAGVSGLAAAFRLVTTAPEVDVLVLEGSERPGGLVRTELVDGFVIDRGPESILTDKPAALRIAKALGLESRIVRTVPERRGAYVVCRGKLERVPDGFSLLAPTEALAFVRSPILSTRGKLRALAEVFLPRGPEVADETLGSFVRRRFGAELLERLAQPLVGGIYSADPDQLSLRATMPRFLDAERTDRSVVLGMRRRLRERAGEAAQGARYGLFINFDQGMQVLPDALAAAVGERVRYRTEVAAIEREGRGFRVGLGDGTELAADGVIVALPAPRAVSLVRPVDATLASSLAELTWGSAAIVTFAYRREQVPHPLDAYGYVTPSVEGRDVIASTWSSEKWPGRAPAGHVLLRFFLGSEQRPAILEAPDDQLVDEARREARSILGVASAPSLVRVDRAVRAMPRYRLGHLDRVAAIEERVAGVPGFALAGAAYRGVGLPDSMQSGENAADRVLAAFRTGR